MSLVNFRVPCLVLLSQLLLGDSVTAQGTTSPPSQSAARRMEKRWLFVWRNMNDAKEADRMIERFPRAAAEGYNGVVFSYNIAPEKAAELKASAQRNGLQLIATVMGGARDRNYVE